MYTHRMCVCLIERAHERLNPSVASSKVTAPYRMACPYLISKRSKISSRVSTSQSHAEKHPADSWPTHKTSTWCHCLRVQRTQDIGDTRRRVIIQTCVSGASRSSNLSLANVIVQHVVAVGVILRVLHHLVGVVFVPLDVGQLSHFCRWHVACAEFTDAVLVS